MRTAYRKLGYVSAGEKEYDPTMDPEIVNDMMIMASWRPTVDPVIVNMIMASLGLNCKGES